MESLNPIQKLKPKLRVRPQALRKPDESYLFLDDGRLNNEIIPDKYILDGYNVAIIPDFIKVYLQEYTHTVDDIWQSIMVLDRYDDTDELEINDIPKLLPGSHPALKYRGNSVARTKLWLQTDFDHGMKRYGYTGWQWRVSLAQRRIECMPLIDELAKIINNRLAKQMHWNHIIATIYNDSDDNIGLHSDKDGDFNPNTGFMVLKLGGARRFQFADLSGKIIYDKQLQPGTAILVGADANRETKHAVPRDLKCDTASGSLVWRSIKKTVSWSTVKSKVAAASYGPG